MVRNLLNTWPWLTGRPPLPPTWRRNMMFMGSLTEKQTFSVQDLGGVRVIF